MEVSRKGSPDTLLVGMWNGAATMKNNMELPQKMELLKCCLVFREGMSFERWFESWENFRFRLSPLFAIFCVILGLDFPFLKNRGKNIYLAESLRVFSEKASVKCSMREERIKHQSSFLPSYFWESPGTINPRACEQLEGRPAQRANLGTGQGCPMKITVRSVWQWVEERTEVSGEDMPRGAS